MKARVLAMLMSLPLLVVADQADIPMPEVIADSDLIMTATLTNIQKQVGEVVTEFRGRLMPATVLYGVLPREPVWLVWSAFTPPMEVEDGVDFSPLEGQARLWLLKRTPDGTYEANYFKRVQLLDEVEALTLMIDEHVKTDPGTHGPAIGGHAEGPVPLKNVVVDKFSKVTTAEVQNAALSSSGLAVQGSDLMRVIMNQTDNGKMDYSFHTLQDKDRWKYCQLVRYPGTRSEGCCGILLNGRTVVEGKQMDEVIETPFGKMRFAGSDMKAAWAKNGWYPAEGTPAVKEPK